MAKNYNSWKYTGMKITLHKDFLNFLFLLL